MSNSGPTASRIVPISCSRCVTTQFGAHSSFGPIEPSKPLNHVPPLPGSTTFVENLNNVKKVRPQVEQYPAISEALGQAIVSVMLGKDQPASALNSAAQAADTALAGK